jgi:hypothetical protein
LWLSERNNRDIHISDPLHRVVFVETGGVRVMTLTPPVSTNTNLTYGGCNGLFCHWVHLAKSHVFIYSIQSFCTCGVRVPL